jgi:hypothetical protein
MALLGTCSPKGGHSPSLKALAMLFGGCGLIITAKSFSVALQLRHL